MKKNLLIILGIVLAISLIIGSFAFAASYREHRKKVSFYLIDLKGNYKRLLESYHSYSFPVNADGIDAVAGSRASYKKKNDRKWRPWRISSIYTSVSIRDLDNPKLHGEGSTTKHNRSVASTWSNPIQVQTKDGTPHLIHNYRVISEHIFFLKHLPRKWYFKSKQYLKRYKYYKNKCNIFIKNYKLNKNKYKKTRNKKYKLIARKWMNRYRHAKRQANKYYKAHKRARRKTKIIKKDWTLKTNYGPKYGDF